MADQPRIAVVIPCLDEAKTIAKVVRDFATALPGAAIYVFDNASRDHTAAVAREAGAQVVTSPRPGKGSVLRHMGEVVDADIYVLVDGDDTYPAEAAPALIERFRRDQLDMLVATRLVEHANGSFRIFHKLGNKMLSRLVSLLFATSVTDVLSGYRILSRDFVRVVRLRTSGFEAETEMTLQALAKRFAIGDMPVRYGARPEGSTSKLDTWSDGFLIIRCLFMILKDYKPLLFFSSIAAGFALVSLISGIGPILEFYQTGFVLRIPRAILATGLAVLALMTFFVGVILDTISKYHAEDIELWKQRFRADD